MTYFRLFVWILTFWMTFVQILDILPTTLGIMDPPRSPIAFTETGVGRGHTKDGSIKTWRKSSHFNQDLLSLNLQKLGQKGFTAKFAGISPPLMIEFWLKIRECCLRPKEKDDHGRNKLLMWLDKLHNTLSWNQVKEQYEIGASTAIGYTHDVMDGILKTFQDTDIITFPSTAERHRLMKINERRGALLPHALFTMDGKHALCTGRKQAERLSHKYKWLPAFNALFIIERVFGTVVAFNLDGAAVKHDVKIFKESDFYQHMDEILDGWTIMADKGYQGLDQTQIAATMKSDDGRKSFYSKEFWKIFNTARGDSERVFAHFFYNKFTQLSRWPGKGKHSFVDWAKNVTCCIVIYNWLKLSQASTI